jgi:Fic family protein
LPTDDATEGAPKEAPSARSEAERERVARLEVDNGFRQFDVAIDAIQYYLHPERPFALRPTLIQDLQKVAVRGIDAYPGQWRSGKAEIEKSAHEPPEAHLVGGLVQEMCDYVNDNWHEKTAFHLSSYIMWRLNWIHPFSDGNGRTSRVTSYIVLCVKLNTLLPGSPTIPQQIQDNRTAYFEALEQADAAYAQGVIDVSRMEEILKGYLANQLLSVIHEADGA